MKQESPSFAQALAQLLVDSAIAAPSLFAGQADVLLRMAADLQPRVSSVAVNVLAATGGILAAAGANDSKTLKGNCQMMSCVPVLVVAADRLFSATFSVT